MQIGAGTKLGRYEIRSKIGEGGIGEVSLTEDTRLHRKVALKTLPSELAANRDSPIWCGEFDFDVECGGLTALWSFVRTGSDSDRIENRVASLIPSLPLRVLTRCLRKLRQAAALQNETLSAMQSC